MSITGWLCPNGKFYECDMYEHIELINNTPALEKLVPWIDKSLDILQDISDDCSRAMSDGEHPSWHCYQMKEMSIKGELASGLLKAGCLRVGSLRDQLHFEGSPTATTLQAAKDLAEGYSMVPVFEGEV